MTPKQQTPLIDLIAAVICQICVISVLFLLVVDEYLYFPIWNTDELKQQTPLIDLITVVVCQICVISVLSSLDWNSR